ncbi:MAG: hypothetical protein C0501_04830 [Isosphaera sp.]|nr:hypothetical protein [Isosphaera sp.]
MPARRRLVLPTAALAALPFVAWSPAASAFFPPMGPPAVVEPVAPPPFEPPPPPPVIVVPPVVTPPVVIDRCPPPVSTPEPATLVGGLAGLAAAAGYRAVRRKNSTANEV